MTLRARFADLPLQSRVLILITLAGLFALFTAAAAIVAYELSTYRPRALEEAREQVQSIAATLTAAVEFQDERTAAAYLNAFGHQRDVRALAITTADGELFAEYLQPGARRIDFSNLTLEGRTTQTDLIVTHPIDTLGGTAQLWMHKALTPLANRLPAYAAFLATAVISLLVLTIMLSLLIRRAITVPVQTLAATAREVTERRDYSRRVPAPHRDEVGQLAQAFNAMLAAIQEREHALTSSESLARRQLLEIQTIYDSSQVHLCVIDREFRHVRINEWFASRVGRDVNDIIGRTLQEVVPESAPMLEAICRQVLETGEPVLNVELQIHKIGRAHV